MPVIDREPDMDRPVYTVLMTVAGSRYETSLTGRELSELKEEWDQDPDNDLTGWEDESYIAAMMIAHIKDGDVLTVKNLGDGKTVYLNFTLVQQFEVQRAQQTPVKAIQKRTPIDALPNGTMLCKCMRTDCPNVHFADLTPRLQEQISASWGSGGQ